MVCGFPEFTELVPHPPAAPNSGRRTSRLPTSARGRRAQERSAAPARGRRPKKSLPGEHLSLDTRSVQSLEVGMRQAPAALRDAAAQGARVVVLALNEAGFGVDPSLTLDLVYNPLGAFLPPPQAM